MTAVTKFDSTVDHEPLT